MLFRWVCCWLAGKRVAAGLVFVFVVAALRTGVGVGLGFADVVVLKVLAREEIPRPVAAGGGGVDVDSGAVCDSSLGFKDGTM